MQYQRLTHPKDFEARRELYRVNKLSLEEMIENLTIIFSEDNYVEESIVFPTEDEIMDLLHNNSEYTVASKDITTLSLRPNQPLAVIWDSRAKRNWFIGFFLDKNEDGTYRVDHLERINGNNERWCRPSGCDDIQDAEEIQILPVSILGVWHFDSD